MDDSDEQNKDEVPIIVIDNKNYYINNKIDEGGYGKIYLVEGVNDHKKYALKILKEEKNSEEDIDQFNKEIKFLGILSDKENDLDSNYIPRIYASGNLRIGEEIYDNLAFVLDLAERGDLFLYVFNSNNGLSEKFSKFIFKKIVEGIKFCHENFICHFDIKIENILLDNDYNPLIADFGLAEELKDSEGNIRNFSGERGTKYAMSPEMFEEGQQYSGVKADIFSLGVLLLAMVLKKRGFRVAHDNERYKCIEDKNYEEFWNITLDSEMVLSDEFKKLYVSMVAYEPKERPSIDQILEDPWLKEINDLKGEQKTKFQKDYKDYMTQINNKINGINETVDLPEDSEEKKETDSETRGISGNGNEYFNWQLKPKKLNNRKKNYNYKYFMKMKGVINPVKFMNSLANNINNKYKDICFIEPSKKKLKFKVIFEKDDETSCDMNIILVEYGKEEYLVHFDRKDSNIEDFYEYFLEIKKIIKKMIE